MKRVTAIAALVLTGLFQCESRVITLGRHPLTNGGSDDVTSVGGHDGKGGSGGSYQGGASSTTRGGSTAGGEGGKGGSSSTPSSFEEPLFGTVELVTELAASDDQFKDENPTLTADQRVIYFTSNRTGGAGSDDVWVAQRSNGDDSFGDPMPVSTVNTKLSESSPAISADGKLLWIGIEQSTDADAGFVGVGLRDIWRFDRKGSVTEFGTPKNETSLNSKEDDIPRPLGNHQLTMPLGSRRAGADAKYTTYLATRPSLPADFGAPVLLEELVVDDMKLTDAFLTDDGLDVYFVRAVNDTDGDIYVAHREQLTVPFGSPLAVSTLNTGKDERDPWLAPDGSRMYFVSDRDGSKRIYQAYRITK